MKRQAVFLDFQGTLGGEGIDDIRTFTFYPFSFEAVKLLNDSRMLVIGITNQSRIGKGLFTMDEFEEKLKWLKIELEIRDAHFDSVYCCPHTKEDNCNCKKPKPGMVDKAMNDFDIDIDKSYVIGDMGKSDMALAKNIGTKCILVLTGVGKGSLSEYRDTWKEIEPDYIASDVLDAVKWIINKK